jgi:hypothetical protein
MRVVSPVESCLALHCCSTSTLLVLFSMQQCAAGCEATPTYAAVSGNIEIVKFLVQQGVVRTDTTDAMSIAALLGQLNVCQYFRTLQCPWDASTSSNAARSGNVALLRWLRENGCPCDPQTLALPTAKSGSIECLEYIRDNGVTLHAAVLTEMLNAAGCEGKLAAVQWLRQQGAEWPHELGMYMCYSILLLQSYRLLQGVRSFYCSSNCHIAHFCV